MDIKNVAKNDPFQVIFILLSVVLTGITAYYNWQIAVIEAAVVLALAAILLIYNKISKNNLKKIAQISAQFLDYTKDNSLENFPFPTVVADHTGKIVWLNEIFEKEVMAGSNPANYDIEQFTSGYSLDEITANGSVAAEYNNIKYSVYFSKIAVGNRDFYMLYFIEDTYLKNTAQEYMLTRPAVLHAVLDNMDEVLQKFKDSEIAVINGELEKIIESWTAQFPCILRRIANGRFFIIAEERGLASMINKKFKILDEIRDFSYDGKTIGVTLSIGGGRGDTMSECDDAAKQSLDMALSRGGDQAAIRTNGNYEFFGGISSGIEKQTKTKTRIISAAIAQLIGESDNVLVMGHCFSDLDSIGAAVGVCSAARVLGKPANIVLYKEKSLAGSIITKLNNSGLGDLFLEPSEAIPKAGQNTMLVIVDTHRAEFLEYRPIYDIIDKIVVIDHHRKTVDYIDDAVIFYNEPGASSAAEMVTEILQYIVGNKPIGEAVANSLLAGIMLDTRNFVLRTGVRSFEAAAYLKGNGADTVAVKQLFANSMENYKQRNSVIGSSVTYKNCAIAVAPDSMENIRILASQVADELLNITGIKSSYVLFKDNGTINISARSMGEMNVQVIMEKLGGGGHQTMAAAQISVSMEAAVAGLKKELDLFFTDNS
ncbi:MAG: DHH family phosphoesterase [Oscillospiraceae bacterium]|jgi:c-di-AMP phosphodiesterase-like protein|nr:DHH family phosphoesterase [Oscillospiraceae bacterium]